MRFEFNNFAANLSDEMRSAGYHYDGQDERTGELRFYRTLSSGLYPRFHIYCVTDRHTRQLAMTLHLDQKAPVYEGATAHAGDYEGPVIEQEVGRLKMHFNRKNFPKPEALDL